MHSINRYQPPSTQNAHGTHKLGHDKLHKKFRSSVKLALQCSALLQKSSMHTTLAWSGNMSLHSAPGHEALSVKNKE